MENNNRYKIEDLVNLFFTFPFENFSNFNSIVDNVVYQLESNRLLFDSFDQDASQTMIKNVAKKDNFYFKLEVNCFKDINKNIIIICIRDNSNLLEFLLPTLSKSAEINGCDILVVDDRSVDLSNVEIAKKYGASCLRVSNDANFYSYSMLNNIAVKVASIFGKSRCIFWNCDMWPPNDETLGRLLEKHDKNNAILSGTRLLYPLRDDFKKIFDGYEHSNGDPEHFFGKIQHAGIIFRQFEIQDGDKTQITPFFAEHQWRYYDGDHCLACHDMPALAVTGALWIISTDDFIKVGGLNPSMPDVCQDMDFCLKLLEQKKPIFYLGSEFLWHAENILHKKFQAERTHNSDYRIFEYIWFDRIKKLIGVDCKY